MPATIAVNSAANPPEIAAHFDLAANDVTTVNFAGVPDASAHVEVIVHSSTAPVWFTTDGSTPVVRGARCYVVPTGSAADTRTTTFGTLRSIKLLSTASSVVSVVRVG